MKVYIVGTATNYACFLKNYRLVDSIENADIIIFTGGEDVDPSLYNCKKHYSTYSNLDRDLKEIEIFKKVQPNQLCIGICRGSQLLAVLNGGKLVQDCDNHALHDTHPITNGKYTFEITSTHHQMQYPYDLDDNDYTVLYTTMRSTKYYGDGIDVNKIIEKGEPEIVLYHKEGYPKCLAIQGHVEMMPDFPVVKMINKLIKDIIRC